MFVKCAEPKFVELRRIFQKFLDSFQVMIGIKIFFELPRIPLINFITPLIKTVKKIRKQNEKFILFIPTYDYLEQLGDLYSLIV